MDGRWWGGAVLSLALGLLVMEAAVAAGAGGDPGWPCPRPNTPTAPPQRGDTNHVNLNLTQARFDVDKGIVAGITYQVWSWTSSNVRDLSLTIPGVGTSCTIGQPIPWTPSGPDNYTISALYRLYDEEDVFELDFLVPVTDDCQVWLRGDRGELSYEDLGCRECLVHLPNSGLLVLLTRLNIPCPSPSRLRFGPRGPSLCGKLEELPDPRFHVKSEWLRAGGQFAMSWKSVHDCYNTTMTSRNGSAVVPPVPGLDCTFSILLPYGYLVSLDLHTSSSTQQRPCKGLLARVWDSSSSWTHCAQADLEPAHLRLISRSNKIIIHVTASEETPLPSLSLSYEASKVNELVGACEFPSVLGSMGQFCLSVEHTPLAWTDAELTCRKKGGHLASVRSQADQALIDNIIINSPGYKETNTYWVGATDAGLEGDFRWSDSLPFAYTNWFPGWGGVSSKQPNDDGLSQQDCVELRRLYRLPPSLTTLTPSFTWNDRDCRTLNYFVCETLASGESMEGAAGGVAECNRTIHLSWEQPKATVTSPGFPLPYPDDVVCRTDVHTPPGYILVVDFEELVIEPEPKCSYDHLDILVEGDFRRLCGDQSDKLKLLRQVYHNPKMTFLFVSDYSNHYTGFKAKLSIEHVSPECGDERLVSYNGSCYLFVSYPEVTWNTARQICQGMKGELSTVESGEEQQFLVTKLRESSDYSTSAIYWLGAKYRNGPGWTWALNNASLRYSGWLGSNRTPAGDESCLSLQWISKPESRLPSGLYWKQQSCDMVGGYVCKKDNQETLALTVNSNRTYNGSEGELASPLYPLPYPHNLDFYTRVVGPEGSRLVLDLERLDLEPQSQCLYDFIEVGGESGSRLCGHYDAEQLQRLRLSTSDNTALIRFKSDYSVSGTGFKLKWRAVDTSGCPSQTLTSSRGEITSPNYPNYLLPNLNCATTIQAPIGKRVLLEMVDYDVEEGIVEVLLGRRGERLRPFSQGDLLSDGIYLSHWEKLAITISTGDNPMGRGFKATFKTVGETIDERILNLSNVSLGHLYHINYPLEPPRNVDLNQRIIAPLGYTIHMQMHNIGSTKLEVNSFCEEGDVLLEVRDPFTEQNGTIWRLCRGRPDSNVNHLSIDSYMNTLTMRQLYHRDSGFRLNASIAVNPDPGYKAKLLSGTLELDHCQPNPCQNGGKCTTSKGKKFCQCIGHFTGAFCALTLCELEPCVFGKCELTNEGFKCHCREGYQGEVCDRKPRPCESNPCDSRGECIESGAKFTCRCHAWWEGTRCERKMIHIPYKPLSERMLQEPFWLGLITVTIVLGILGLFWCAKRHFPEKLEKLLAEDDRNRAYAPSGRCSSVRERHHLTPSASVTSSASVHLGPVQGKNNFLGRLGIRKPSLVPSPSSRTARTFSLDDLLKPPPRTPSPRKKRNNSTPIKKTSDKKQILQQLVSPGLARQASGEAIALSQTNNSLTVEVQPPNNNNNAETSFSSNITNGRGLDPKLEKKVTFARLLDKVSSEISSGSEVESGGPPSLKPAYIMDSRSSSELQLNTGEAMPGGRKATSADSLLAMLRGLAQQQQGSSPPPSSSSSTPTTTTPRDDGPDTPMSSSSGISDSPPMYIRRNTIQVAVVDPLNAQRDNNLLQPPTILLEVPNKCLSPIREVPTPSPSPALTPTMPRHNPHNPMALLSPLPFKSTTIPKLDLGRKEESEVTRPTNIVIPVVRVEEVPSPTKPFRVDESLKKTWGDKKPHLKDLEKPASLDLACPPPVITVTCSLSEVESDADSPAGLAQAQAKAQANMCYLSPFSICSRGDRTTSESNLSSSGYSSMASPAPSRCGSNNPLCLTDLEDNHHIPRRPSPLLRTPSEVDNSRRGRSDSETYSDDQILESNDEGFATDHDKKDLKKFLETDFPEKAKAVIDLTPPPGSVKHCRSFDTGLERYKRKTKVKHCSSVEAGLDRVRNGGDDSTNPRICKVLLQLPSIIVDGEDPLDPHCSPVSSRSESPLSDKTGLGRFSPMFYGRLTDSDGLYDASSDCAKASKKHSGKKKERRRSKSPTKGSLLDVPGKTDPLAKGVRSKPSPKRRSRPKPVSSTSSSSAESLNSIRDLSLCLSPEKLNEKYNTNNTWHEDKDLDDCDVMSKMIPNNKKISRMKTVGNQIRFLRRLEKSLKRSRESQGSPERPLLGRSEERREKRLSWLRQRGAASDSLLACQDEDHNMAASGHTD